METGERCKQNINYPGPAHRPAAEESSRLGYDISSGISPMTFISQ